MIALFCWLICLLVLPGVIRDIALENLVLRQQLTVFKRRCPRPQLQMADRLFCLWPSIPPERLLCALLLQIFYSVRGDRLLMEQLDYNLLFRWFVGMAMDEKVWDHSVFSKNRDRLLNEEIAEDFFSGC
jgi:hypothetical protein